MAIPDYLNYPSATALAVDNPEAVRLGLRLKKLGNSIQEAIGGRAVHPVNAVPGGFGRTPSVDQLIALRDGLLGGMTDCEAAIGLMATLPTADFCHSQTVFAALRSPRDYGYYAGDEVIVLANGDREVIPASSYRFFTNESAVRHSHAKHSSYRGRPFMVGSLARLSINREQLSARAGEAIEKMRLTLPSDNPTDNNKAQAVELICDVERALHVVERLLDHGLKDEPPVAVVPRAGTGTAVTEAPRGLLIHSYTYDGDGRITAADVITPTALNAASIEDHLRRAVEHGAPREGPALTRTLEMIARAYDPCISCSVHLVRKRDAT